MSTRVRIPVHPEGRMHEVILSSSWAYMCMNWYYNANVIENSIYINTILRPDIDTAPQYIM